MNEKAINARAEAWAKYQAEHAEAFNLASCTNADYLHNRLWWAFQAGVEAGERSATERADTLPGEQPRKI